MRSLSLALVLSAAAALPALAQPPQPSAAQLHLRMLTWPGKVEPAARPPAQDYTRSAYGPPAVQPAPQQMAAQQMAAAPSRPAQDYARAAYGPPAVQPAARQQTANARRDLAWRPAYRPLPHGPSHFLGDLTPAQATAIQAQRAEDAEQEEKGKALLAQQQAEAKARQEQALAARGMRLQDMPSAQPAGRSLPTSIYGTPPPAQASAQLAAPVQPQAQALPAPRPAQVASASPYDQHAHFYSLHRAYGQQPDPVTLSPQFMNSPSADMAEPPPPPPPHILAGTTATAAQQTAARVQARDGSDSAS